MTAKLSFRKWLDLETQKKILLEAVDGGEFPDKVFAFLSTASVSFNEKDTWENSVFCFMTAVKELRPNDSLPLVKDAPKDGKPADWDYEGRTWAYWSHVLAQAYGWTLEYIAELDVNEALSHIQEIFTDEHLEKEFYYGLSEVAYPYNKSTKKSVFKPMPRPYWMKPTAKPVKMQTFKKSMLPMGLVQDVSGMPDEYNPLRDYVEKKTKETKPTTNPPVIPPA